MSLCYDEGDLREPMATIHYKGGLKIAASEKQSVSRKEATEILQKIVAEVEEDILGQRSVVESVVYAFLAGGHVLMSGVPGLGKTRLVRVFANRLNLSFGRIQYTPDLLPSDITGSEILQRSSEEGKRTFEFMKGPIFHNLILADEINRASPRTQAAMLEAMEERAVTYGGTRYPLPHPFMVCATQNPLEFEGTYPLPEAQLDRFLLYVVVDYPKEEDELAILKYHHQKTPKSPSQSKEESPSEKTRPWESTVVLELQKHAQNTTISPEVMGLVNALVRSTRKPLEKEQEVISAEDLSYGLRFGAGPRGGLALIATAKVRAFSLGEEEVRWRHVCHVALPVLRHRISLAPSYLKKWGSQDNYIQALLEQVAKKHRLSSQ